MSYRVCKIKNKKKRGITLKLLNLKEYKKEPQLFIGALGIISL
jgi:hypothetical protein